MQAVRPAQAAKQSTETSTAFLSTMMSAAIQCVIYLRGVFPEKAFGEGEICGVPIRRLEPGSEFVEAQSFLRFIEEGVLKAIQLDVLSSVEVLFQTQQNGPIVERYCFGISSSGALCVSNSGSPAAAGHESVEQKNSKRRETNDAVRVMLRKLLVTTDSLTPMPSGCLLSLRLIYKEGVAPEFEPLHFRTGGHELRMESEQAAMDLNLGRVGAGVGHAMEFTVQALPEHVIPEKVKPSSSSVSSSSASSSASSSPAPFQSRPGSESPSVAKKARR